MHRWGPLALAALVAVVLTGLLATQVPGSACSSLAITVTSSEEKSQLLNDLAGSFNATHQCVSVRVVRAKSGATEQALAAGWNDSMDGPKPDVWSPAAVTWILLLNQALAGQHRAAMAQAIELSGQPIGWSDLFQLASDPSGWSRYGHPEFGAFQLAKTDPLLSTSGLHALIGTYFAASGRSSNLTSDVLNEPSVASFVSGVERTVVHYGDSVSNFLLNLQAADDGNRALTFVSAIAMEEKEVWDYNQGNPTGNPATLGQHPLPRVPLVAIYPKEGTLAADHPYAILDAPWVTSDKRRAAGAFLQYLQSTPAQARFQAEGFRDQRGSAGPLIAPANGLRPELPGAYLQLPPAPVIQAVQASWSLVRRRARILLLIDSSALAGCLDASRFAQSLRTGLKQLAADDQAGAWVFPGTGSAAPPYSQLAPVQLLQADGATLQGAISALKSSSGRVALYSALQAAVSAMASSIDASRINAVLLISAGRSTDPDDAARFPTLNSVSTLAAQIPGVHVFTIAVGNNRDRANMRQIALEGKGASYDACDPASVGRALNAVISNF